MFFFNKNRILHAICNFVAFPNTFRADLYLSENPEIPERLNPYISYLLDGNRQRKGLGKVTLRNGKIYSLNSTEDLSVPNTLKNRYRHALCNFYAFPDAFNPIVYLDCHDDVKDSRTDPYKHYLKYGRKEKRRLGLPPIKAHTPIVTTVEEPQNHRLIAKYASDSFLSTGSQASDLLNNNIILCISHEASLTGAPIALKSMAMSLAKLGYVPIFITPTAGPLLLSLKSEGLSYAVIPSLFTSNFVIEIRKYCTLVVCCTLPTIPVVRKLLNTDTPVLWWIHESKTSYHIGLTSQLPFSLTKNIHIFAGGDYAKRILRKYRPNYLINTLLYPVADKPRRNHENLIHSNNALLIACIGTLSERKAQDRVISAIHSLPPCTRARAHFIFIGQNFDDSIYRSIQDVCRRYDNIEYIAELPTDKLELVYHQMDVLVSAALDDPMPIVVTEALRLGKLVVCADTIGTMPLIKKHKAGLIFHNPADEKEKSVENLMECLSNVIQNRVDLSQFKLNARKTYEQYFSESVFQKKLSSFIHSVENRTVRRSVSVIIPTYNGGARLLNLLKSLKKQTGVEDIEIIMVDSESTDGTPSDAVRLGVTLVRIRHEDFQHGAARNLGVSKARNDIVLFLTQDIVIQSREWLRNCVDTLIQNHLDALSGPEEQTGKSDLFFRTTSRSHQEIFFDGVIRTFEDIDKKGIRYTGSLNNTNCFVLKSVFDSFSYRRPFAEDLELGIYLINKGCRVLLNNRFPVIHDHSRNIDYYLSRSYISKQSVDALIKANLKICNEADYIPDLQLYFNILKSNYTIKRQISRSHNHLNNIVEIFKENLIFLTSLGDFSEDSFEYPKAPMLNAIMQHISVLRNKQYEDCYSNSSELCFSYITRMECLLKHVDFEPTRFTKHSSMTEWFHFTMSLFATLFGEHLTGLDVTSSLYKDIRKLGLGSGV